MRGVFIILILFISRILFLSPLPIYFDSPEYVLLIENPNLLAALTGGHEPIHPGYILPAWILDKALPFLGVIYAAGVISALFSALGLYIFYKIAQILFDKKVAIRALVIASILPVLFLSGVNVLTDTTYIFFYLFSFYSLLLFTRTKSKKWFIFGALSLSYAVFTHVQVVFWLPVFLAPVILAKKKNIRTTIRQVVAFLTLGVFLGVFLLTLLLMFSGNSIPQSLQLLFMHGNDVYTKGNITLEILRAIRNFGIVILRNNSTIVIMAALVGSFILYNKDKKKFLILALWFLPALVTTQYFHIGLFGRVAIISSFPLVLLAAQIKSRIIFAVIILQLIVITVPLAIDNKNASIQKELVSIYSSIPENSVLISSNLIRPQVTYSGDKYFINEPGHGLEFIESKITYAFMENKNVYIDSQALYNPYYSYDGNNLHVLSLGKAGNSEIKSLFDMYQTRIIKKTQNPRIFLYKIEGSSNRETEYAYEYSKELINTIHPSRIDYRDVGTWIWVLISGRREPISWRLE